MSMSGIPFDNDGKKAIEEFGNVKHIRDMCVLKIADSSVTDCKYTEIEKEYEIPEIVDFLKNNKDSPHWVAFDLLANVQEGSNVRQAEKRVLVSYCPDSLGVKDKMKHASTHLMVKKALAPQKEVKMSSEEELDSEGFLKLCSESVFNASDKPETLKLKHPKKK